MPFFLILSKNVCKYKKILVILINKIINFAFLLLSLKSEPKIMKTSSSSSQKNYAKTFNNKLDALTKSPSTTLITSQTSLINSMCEQALVSSASVQAFRIPSSRHFCGRLLSTNLSHTDTSTSTTSSYINQNQNASFEDGGVEGDDDDEDLDEEDEDAKNSPLIMASGRGVIATGALSTSSPSTASSSPKSHSPGFQQTLTTQQSQKAPQLFQSRSVSNEQRNVVESNGNSVANKNVQFRSSSSNQQIYQNVQPHPQSQPQPQLQVQQSNTTGYDNLNNLINPVQTASSSQTRPQPHPHTQSQSQLPSSYASMKKSVTTQEIDRAKRFGYIKNTKNTKKK